MPVTMATSGGTVNIHVCEEKWLNSARERLTFMFRRSLNTSLRRIWEHSARDTKADLRTDDTRMRSRASTTAEVDEEAEGDHEETCSGHDEGFEAADFEHNEAEREAGEHGGEAVERSDAGGGLDGLVEGNDEDGVEEVTLHVPRCCGKLVEY